MNITVPLAEADVINKNGRIYTTELLNKIADENASPIVGTFSETDDAPLEPNPTNITHEINNLRFHNSRLIGDVVVGHSSTQIVNLLENKMITFSTRGTGFVGANGEVELDSYQLYGIDAIPTEIGSYNFGDVLDPRRYIPNHRL